MALRAVPVDRGQRFRAGREERLTRIRHAVAVAIVVQSARAAFQSFDLFRAEAIPIDVAAVRINGADTGCDLRTVAPLAMRPFAAVMEHFDFAFVRHAISVAIETLAVGGSEIAGIVQAVGVAVEE